MAKKSGARALRTWALIIFILLFIVFGAVSAFSLKVYFDRQKDGGVPEFYGYSLASVGDSSMEPQISKGSMVLYTPSGESTFYYVDEVLMLYEDNGYHPVKRLVDAQYKDGKFEYSLKGDADTMALTLPADAIYGKVKYSVPFVGYLLDFTKTFDGLVMAIAVPFAFLLLIELILLIIAAGVSKKEKKYALEFSLLPDDDEEEFVDVTSQFVGEKLNPQDFLFEPKFKDLDFNPLAEKEKETTDEVESVTINTKEVKNTPVINPMEKTLTMSVNGAEMAEMLLKKGQNFKIKVGEFTVNIEVE